MFRENILSTVKLNTLIPFNFIKGGLYDIYYLKKTKTLYLTHHKYKRQLFSKLIFYINATANEFYIKRIVMFSLNTFT